MSLPQCLMLQTSVCCDRIMQLQACMTMTLVDPACLPKSWWDYLSLLVEMAASEMAAIAELEDHLDVVQSA